MPLKRVLCSFLILTSVSIQASVSAFAAGRQSNAQAAAQANSAAEPKGGEQDRDEGERVFQQHCSRCHTAPDGFSPRISGTILRHMRVRASLSQREEKELLRFFNP